MESKLFLDEACEAVIARIYGEWDNKALKKFGPLSVHSTTDILNILKPAMGGYTVILLYPNDYNVCGKPETYTEYSSADSPEKAIEEVKAMASKANHYDIDADDFDLIAVFKGNQLPELGTI